MKSFKSLKSELVKFIKFNLVGIINTGVDAALYTLLTALGVIIPVAQTLSYAAGTLTSWLLNSRWTFGSKKATAGKVVKFILVNIAALCVSIAALTLLEQKFGIVGAPAKLLSLPFSMAVNYGGNRLFVFK